MQYGPDGAAVEFDMNPGAYGIFAAVQPVEFRRVLSNLLNNAAEAMEKELRVMLTLTAAGGRVIIKVTDNGKGIQPEILARLGQRGATFGKPGGSGLGLYHAKTSVENWGGKLAIVSEAGSGTTVSLELPEAAAPCWFVSALEIPPGRAVVVLDDDETIHRVWRGRLESARAAEKGVEFYSFSAPDRLRGWIKDNPGKAAGAIYLLDYELLGSKETGLTLAKALGLESRAVLVTSRYEEKHIFEECLRLKMKMVPKGLAGLVPLAIKNVGGPASGRFPAAQSGCPAVLIDDDALVNMNWKMAAKAAGVELKAYKESKDFMASLDGVAKNAPIYIDSDLGNNIKGEDIAKDLHEKGFTDLTMATGHGPEKFAHLPWLKVTGKEPPFGPKTGM